MEKTRSQKANGSAEIMTKKGSSDGKFGIQGLAQKELSAMQKQELKKQMEYYMGDKNLARDDFFRDKIKANKNGYITLTLFQNCNKIKSLAVTEK